MYVIEFNNSEWICSESKKRVKEYDNASGYKNVWYQPFNYLSGVMSDFFWTIKDGVQLENEIPMRNWKDDLPLSKFREGVVKCIGRVPKWYREILEK